MTAPNSHDASGCKRIDVHAHFLPPVYREALRDAGFTTLDGGMPIPDWTPDMALGVMDQFSIAASILSVSSPGINFLEAAQGAKLARAINEAAAALVKDHPGRFGGFATLPLPHIALSLAEIMHAFDRLGLDGVILETNANGVYLGAPELAPIFDALNARKALIFLHPTSPACFAQVGLGRPAPMIEFPFDTTRAVVDLIYSGTIRRCPDLKFIVPHGGGTLPFLSQRIANFAGMPFVKSAAGSPEDVMRALSSFYYDITMATHPGAFNSLRELAPISQLLYGSDWPFTPTPVVGMGIAAFERLSGLTEQDRAAIEYGNALHLFPRFLPALRGASS